VNFPRKAARALIALLLILAGILAYMGSTGQLISVSQNIIGTVTTPFQKLNTGIGNVISGISQKTSDVDDIIAENERLKEELKEMRLKVRKYNRLEQENKAYKELLGIQDTIREYTTQNATVIGRDGTESFYSFTIDKGSSDGIKVNDVVFSRDGIVGVVIDTGIGFSKVSTILSPAVSAGCFVGTDLDIAVLSGNYDLSDGEYCLAQYLPKNTTATEGDIVTTSGLGMVFPPDFLIGTVESVDIDQSGNYMTARVKPAADIRNVKIVFVITDYNR